MPDLPLSKRRQTGEDRTRHGSQVHDGGVGVSQVSVQVLHLHLHTADVSETARVTFVTSLQLPPLTHLAVAQQAEDTVGQGRRVVNPDPVAARGGHGGIAEVVRGVAVARELGGGGALPPGAWTGGGGGSGGGGGEKRGGAAFAQRVIPSTLSLLLFLLLLGRVRLLLFVNVLGDLTEHSLAAAAVTAAGGFLRGPPFLPLPLVDPVLSGTLIHLLFRWEDVFGCVVHRRGLSWHRHLLSHCLGCNRVH